MSKRVLVPLAEGFEEIEAATIIDVLRRGGVDVVTAALADTCVKGAHGVCVCADTTLEAALSDGAATFDAVVLPGGMPGAEHLRDDARVRGALQDVLERGGTAAAICAAPIALEAAGVLSGRRATCYPGFDAQLTSAAEHATERVVEDGPVITSRGPGTALEFATFLVERLVDKATADGLREGMLVAS
jgi:4-methyl-5(b-hydroxyethyl)-thiazole monophosphate biosynthesis